MTPDRQGAGEKVGALAGCYRACEDCCGVPFQNIDCPDCWRVTAEAIVADVRRFDLALQSLTPGGSEFVRDPERCVAYVKDLFHSGHEAKKDCVRLRSQRDELAAHLQGVLVFSDRFVECIFCASSVKDRDGKRLHGPGCGGVSLWDLLRRLALAKIDGGGTE